MAAHDDNAPTPSRSDRLDALDAQHLREAGEEARADLLDAPRPMRLQAPAREAMVRSQRWLHRLIDPRALARRPAPVVLDHLRALGPWFATLDDTPWSGLNASSRTGAGFGEDVIARAYVEGEFGALVGRAHDGSRGDDAQAYAAAVAEHLPAYAHLILTDCASDALGRALAVLGDDNREGARGALLWTSSASTPADALGDLPLRRMALPCAPSRSDDADAPLGPLDLAHMAALAERAGPLSSRGPEARLIADTLRALAAFTPRVCVLEPAALHNAGRAVSLRLVEALCRLARDAGAPVLVDLTRLEPSPLDVKLAYAKTFAPYADAIAWTTPTRGGAIASTRPDPHPPWVEASAVRWDALRLDAPPTTRASLGLAPRVARLAERHSSVIIDTATGPRACTLTLRNRETTEALRAHAAQLGVLVGRSGDPQAAHLRLAPALSERELDTLFDALDRALAQASQPGAPQPAPSPRPRLPKRALRIRRAAPDEAPALVPAIMDLEARIFEPARRDSAATLSIGFEPGHGVAVVAEAPDGDGGDDDRWRVVGYALGGPLERFTHLDGPDRDVMRDRHNTLYSIAISIDPDWRGQGLGRRLKTRQFQAARDLRRPDGSPRYAYITGRNRVGFTAAMSRINRILGGHTVYHLTHQYGEPDGQAIYYRIPLRDHAPDPALRDPTPADAATDDLSGGLAQPCAAPPDALTEAEHNGQLFGPVVNQLGLRRFITPAAIRAVEWLRLLAPDTLPHTYCAPGRDATLELALDLLRDRRPNARVAIGLTGGHMGRAGLSAQALSDPRLCAVTPALSWPLLPHPDDVEDDATWLAMAEALLCGLGGPSRAIALVAETAQARTGVALDDRAWRLLGAVRDRFGVPLVLVETTTAAWRSGLGPLASHAAPITPDVIAWWAGGRIGVVHAAARLNPATLNPRLGLWRGDELSLLRLHHTLRAVRHLDLSAPLKALDRALAQDRLDPLGAKARGLGLFRVLEAPPPHLAKLQGALQRHNLHAPTAPCGRRLVIAPPLDRAEALIARLDAAIERAAHQEHTTT